MATRTLDIGDATIVADVVGSGRTVVCVSGIDGRASFWRKQAETLCSNRRVITYDQRGSGSSSHSRIRYSVGQMADDLLSMLDALEIETASVVGHGLGSVVALQFCMTHAERIEKLVLGAPWAEPSSYGGARIRLMQGVLSHCGRESYLLHELLSSAPASWLHARPWLLHERVVERCNGLAATEIETSRLQAAAECNILARLANVRVRALVIAAADDQVVPHVAARQVALAMPTARFELLESGGHLCTEAATDAYNDLLTRFLDE